ncbi:GDSL esterase/lipase At5g45960-like isoform X2 [Cornus florida]|uniref:GDSL esterase/lipase At5g45960-like isoform X2 n=1 Tax=Cornus florida TaxID=4283 RepID=UPI00289ECCD4|nr:GDSL esterase/lipase At5g45960-like isoform X2 [Cornus florida]
MSSAQTHFLITALFSMLIILISKADSAAQTLIPNNQKPINNSIPAAFIFGDSTVDSGNNNYIMSPFKSNFPPYGRDFPNHIPTGRFSNGRLVTDFIVSYVGIKDFVPPYLDPTLTLQELMTGVSFASASSGFDPLTPQLSQVIPIPKQVEYLKEYKSRVEVAIGKKRTKNLMERAIFVVSAGTNDFVFNYFGTPFRRKSYSVSTYTQFLMQHIQKFLQDLTEQGARQILVAGLPPMGCLPVAITLYSGDAFHQRRCVETLSSVARDYNNILQNKLKSMQNNTTNILYIDIYKPLSDMIQRQGHFGFEDVSNGCCGTGLVEASILCNSESAVCGDASKYVFWDSVHPTQKTYDILSQSQSIRSVIDSFIHN